MHSSTLIGSPVARRLPVVWWASRRPTGAVKPAHVPGLYVICAVELYERLASVMVLSLLVLYLNECLGLDTGRAAKVASYVHMLSYVAGVLGGVLADRGLGARVEPPHARQGRPGARVRPGAGARRPLRTLRPHLAPAAPYT